MLLEQLIQEVPGARIEGTRPRSLADRDLRGVTPNPRGSGPGIVFVSLPELQRKNPYQAHAAMDRGSEVVIRDEATPAPPGAVSIVVKDVREALGHAASALQDHPSRRLTLFGIGGESGARSRLAGVLAALLSATGRDCARWSPEACVTGDRIQPWRMESVDAVHLQRELARHVERGGAACVVELTEGIRELGLCMGMEFRSCVEAMDGPMPAGLEPLRLSVRGSQFRWRWRGEEHRVYTALRGRGQLAALGQALELAAGAGVPVGRLIRALPELSVAHGWMEPVEAGQGFGVFVDAAREGRELGSTLGSARELASGRLIVVTGPRPTQSGEERAALARAAGAGADVVLVAPDNAAGAEYGMLAAEFREAASGGGAVVVVEEDRHRALHRACAAARPGDVVVAAGKALSPVQMNGVARVPWDDRLHLGMVLGRLGYVGTDFGD